MIATRALVETALAVLEQRKDPRATQAGVARLFGLAPQNMYAYIQGRRRPSDATMTAWLTRWESEGLPPLVLMLSARGAECAPVSP